MSDRDKVIGSDNPLSKEDRGLLRILVGTMIPENEEYHVPGADDAAIFANILARAAAYHQQISESLKELDKISQDRHGEGFAAIDFDDRVKLLNDFRQMHVAAVQRIASIAVRCYYLDGRVMASLDMDVRPPYPNGFTVPDGDWSLLEPVRQRSKLYRELS